ncbi:MAG: hypothetical protein IPL25_13010 [Saprospiraceae bacterium]|nr:hypothetical protein [Candidatus Vicinibacter affinis]
MNLRNTGTDDGLTDWGLVGLYKTLMSLKVWPALEKNIHPEQEKVTHFDYPLELAKP